MFPLDISYLKPNLGNANRLYFRHGNAYIRKVLAIEPSDLILYHPMGEPSDTIAYDKSAQENDGAYTGVTLGHPGIGDGNTSPLFDGVSDYNDFHSAGFASDFDKDAGSLFCWCKVYNVGVWTDGTSRQIAYMWVHGDHFITIEKRSNDNQVRVAYKAGGTLKGVNVSGLTSVGWNNFGLTWDTAEDEVIAYLNGIQSGSTQSGLGAWVGSPSVNRLGHSGGQGAGNWYGWMAHATIWKTVLTPTQVLEVGTL